MHLFFILLLMLGAVGQLSSDLYLPSLPFIAKGLATSTYIVQLTLSAFLLGLALAQLIYAPLSDALGRKKPLLTGLTICLLGTIICFWAPSVHILLVGRFIQGLGAGVGDSLSRAILRDTFQDVKLARFASYLTIGHVAILAAAPFLGGYIQYYFGWRTNFLFLIVYCVTLLLVLSIGLPETNPNHVHNRIIDIKKHFVSLMRCHHFVIFSLITSMVYGGIIAWLTVAPALLEQKLGFLPQNLGWIALLLGLIFACGSIYNAKKVVEKGLYRMIKQGLFLMLLSAFLMHIFYLNWGLQMLALVFPVAFFLFGTSLVFSNGFAYALYDISDSTGLGCALFSFIQIIGGVVSSSLISILHEPSPKVLAVMMALTSGCSLLLLLFGVKEKTMVVKKH